MLYGLVIAETLIHHNDTQRRVESFHGFGPSSAVRCPDEMKSLGSSDKRATTVRCAPSDARRRCRDAGLELDDSRRGGRTYPVTGRPNAVREALNCRLLRVPNAFVNLVGLAAEA